ncbi:hypothetical protein [Cellulomonas biazotea]|uniref:Uncharacterized protein n=1 Tax=Cellulomonas biazotea TaxID=1709 RepID=A0A402DNB3_9CELL|nr:hypothetical protein [Cellulomonas biazotea]GCE75596.1 hypothetical protein CBZ_06520 [Cellulomonas biazotea]
MQQKDWGPALVGTAIGFVTFVVVNLLVVPTVGRTAATGGAVALGAVLLLLQLVAPLVAGVVAARRRRNAGTERRADAVPAAALAGTGTGLVVGMLGAALELAKSEGVDVVSALVTLVLFVAVGALAGLLVAPRSLSTNRSTVSGRPAWSGYDDAGQASLESLGAIGVAVLLVVTLVTVMTPGGQWLQDNLAYHLCRIVTLGQGGCGAPPTIDQAQHKPTQACVVDDMLDGRQASVSVMFVAVEGGGTIRVETMSDDTYRVSVDGQAGAGLTAGVGGGLNVTVDDKIHGGEAQASAAAYVAAGGGATWVVDEKGKTALVDYLKEQRDWATLAATGPLGGAVSTVGNAGGQLLDWVQGDLYTPPAPDELFGYAGILADGSASAASLVQGGAVSGNAATVLGSRIDVKTGALTTFYRTTYEGEAKLTQQDGINETELGAGGKAEIVLAVTVDPEGNPVKITATGLAAGNAKAEISNLFAGELLAENPSGGTRFEASLELTGPETVDIGLGLLQASGITTKNPVQRYEGGKDAVTTFLEAARQRGILTRQDVTYDSDTSLAAQLNAKIGPVGFGADFANTQTTVTSGDAFYYNGSGWNQWTGCSQ